MLAIVIGEDTRRGLNDGTRVERASEGVQVVAQAVVADGALAVGTERRKVGPGQMDIPPAARACANRCLVEEQLVIVGAAANARRQNGTEHWS